MNKLILLLFISIPQTFFAQDLVLTGGISYYDMKETGKIYYTQPGKPFDAKKFITYDKQKGYTFKMNIAKIRKENIQTLVFAADTTQRSSNENACAQRIHVGEIVNAPEFKDAKSIKLKNDLLLDMNCEATVLYDAKSEGKDRFVGTYQFRSDDTVRTVTLGNILFNYTSRFSKNTGDHMTEEFGSWSFNGEKNILSFHIWRQENKRFGLVISKYTVFSFDVSETANSLTFTSTSGSLNKL